MPISSIENPCASTSSGFLRLIKGLGGLIGSLFIQHILIQYRAIKTNDIANRAKMTCMSLV